ncbi:MAG: hypothetical protein DRP47_03615 [Candidatus Zixiibacteriota bacterium]|nr:MAG: hypothetical protein DRP47_03615 [candidate division Zixibacteria bacterium]
MRSRVTIKNSTDDETLNDTSAFNPFELVTLFVTRRKWIAGTVGTIMVLTALVVLLIPNQYKSVATLLPSGPVDKMADLKSIAGLGGFTASDENSSELFPTILTSQTVREIVLNTKYDFDNDGSTMSFTLPEYFNIENRDKLHRELAKITSVSNDKKTGVITIAVETKYPAFSQAILTKYIAELESFNIHKRRSQAKESAKYLARELEKRKKELIVIEDSLLSYQQVNRDWMGTSDPFITMTVARFQRDLEIKNQAVFYLTGELEAAKLNAQKDVPIVRILDQPSLPIVKSGPARTAIVLLVGVTTFIFMLFIVVFAEAARKASRGEASKTFNEMKIEISNAFPISARVVNRMKRVGQIPAG